VSGASLAGHATVQALGWALVHSLWQGVLAGALLFGLNKLLRRRSAALRYAAASTALLLMLALPLATFLALRWKIARPGSVRTETDGFEQALFGSPSVVEWADPGRLADLRERIGSSLPSLVTAWCLGVLLLSLRFAGGLAAAQRLKGDVRPLATLQLTVERLRRGLRVSLPVRVCQSMLVEVPTVIGWWRPVILLPVEILTGLDLVQLEALLAHELAHIRRYDYLVNLVQTVVETLLFYHPVVWWVSHRMRVEREHCCDDAAVAVCGDAVSYARTLTKLEGLRLPTSALALGARGGSLFERISRLVGAPSHASLGSRGLAGAAVVALLVIGGTAGAWSVRHGPSLGCASRVSSAVEVPRPAADALKEADGKEERVPVTDPSTDASIGERAPAPPDPPQPPDAPTPPEPPPPSPPEPPLWFSPDDLVSLSKYGIGSEDGDAMTALGYASLSAAELIRLRSYGVGPAFVADLQASGYKGLTLDQLIALRSHGVSPGFVRDLVSLGLGALSPENLVQLRSHGVQPEEARALKALGYQLSSAELIELRRHGVRLEFIQGMNEATGERLSFSRLVFLRSQGVTPEFVKALKDLGYQNLSPARLVALSSHGVTLHYIDEFNRLGYTNLSVSWLIGLRSHGVTPEFVSALRDLGYERLSVGSLVALRAQGVTPEYVRGLQDAGCRALSADDLIRLRSRGAQPNCQGARSRAGAQQWGVSQ
jgi:beta-lactamase regulating signal transducer with metallopeptidase domain